MEQNLVAAVLNFLFRFDPAIVMVLCLMAIATPAGVVAIILLLTASHQRGQAAVVEVYRADMTKVLDSYGEHIKQVSQYYKDNVELVIQYQSVANDLKEIIVLNTQTITKLCDAVNTNRFCPVNRVKKEQGEFV